MKKIEELRRELNMSLKEFSEYYEIPYNTIRQWEKGERTPPNYVIRLLNEVIDLKAKGEQLEIINDKKLYIIEYLTIYADSASFSCYESEYKRAQSIKCFFTDKKLYKYIKTYECYKKEP